MEKKNKKKTRVNPETTILSVAEIEGILNKETLKNLPALVDEMDENLAININNFLTNSIFKGISFDKQNIIDIVKQSKKLHYDNKSQFIRFKEKADRNMIIFRNVVETDGDVIPKCEFIKNAIGNKSKCLIGKLKEVDRVEKNIMFIFDNEDHTQEIEKLMNLSLKNQEKDFANLDFTLAAETLKRRISPLMNYDNSFEDQIEIINSILINPTPYIPRRFTVGNNAKTPSKKLLMNNTQIQNQDKTHVSMGIGYQQNYNLGNVQSKNNPNLSHPNKKNLQSNVHINNDNNGNINHNNNRINRHNQNNSNYNVNNTHYKNNNINNAFNLSSINNNSQYNFPNQNLTMNNSYFNPNSNLNLNNSVSFNNSYAYMKGYLNALSSINVFNQNVYNSLLLNQQKNNIANSTLNKSKSPNKKRISINKFDTIGNNCNSVLNMTNNKTNIFNSTNNIQSFSMNNDLNRKSIEENIGRRSPSLKKLEISNADYYANLINTKNLNNTSMINNPNNSTLVNISLAENDNNNTTTIDNSTNDKSIYKKTENLNLSVVKEKNEDENGNQVCGNKTTIDLDNEKNEINVNIYKEFEKNKKDYLESNRNSIAFNFENFNPANFYNQNLNNNNKSNINNNYYFGSNCTPINSRNNAGRHGSMTSLNLNFSTSNKKASIFSNDGYFQNSIFQNTSANNQIYDTIKNFNNINNNETSMSYLDPNNNGENENYAVGRVKSKTIHNKMKNFNNLNINNLQKMFPSNFTNSTNTNSNAATTTNNPNNYSGTPLKQQNFRFESRQSKLSNFNENLLSNTKKMSFLSYGDEINLISEFNKNMKFIPDQSRKSSLNFLSMLKSQDLSKYRNSAFSIENDLGILKEYENNAEKSANIEFQYETNDIISVYFHMNYLKLFEFPDEFKDGNFIEGIMTNEVKGNIEKLKEKKLIIKKKANNVLHKSFNLKMRHNSTSKIRLSQNVNSYQLMSLMEENLDVRKNKRKRHCSLKN